MIAITVSKANCRADSAKFFPVNRAKLKVEAAKDLSATSFFFDSYDDAIVAESIVNYVLEKLENKKILNFESHHTPKT